MEDYSLSKNAIGRILQDCSLTYCLSKPEGQMVKFRDEQGQQCHYKNIGVGRPGRVAIE